MGRLSKILSFIRSTRNGAKVSDVKHDPGGGANITSEHTSAPGDDSNPLPGDYVATIYIRRSGGEVVVGYVDPKNTSKAAAGEKRIYSRNSAGAEVVELWLKNDGTAVLENANGSVTLAANGDVSIVGKAISITGDSIAITGATDINGATISATGEIATASGVDLDTHIHGGVTPGGGNTGAPV